MRTLSLFFCLASAAMPATIMLSTTCSSSSETVAGVTSCGVGDGVGYGRAQASATFAVSGNTVSLGAQTSASGAPGIPSAGMFYQPFSASATVAITADLYTTGALRQGYVVIAGVTQTQDQGVGGGDSSYSIGSAFSLACPVNKSCSLAPGSNLMPIELGTTFTFTETQSADGSSDPFEFLGEGAVNTSETFTFFEADGTQVAVFDAGPTAVPEPGSWGLLGLGLAGLAAVATRIKR